MPESRLPLPLFQVLEEEYAQLHGPVPYLKQGEEQWLFTVEQFRAEDSADRLASRVHAGAHATPPDEFLLHFWNALDEEDRRVVAARATWLEGARDSEEPAAKLDPAPALVRGLNALVKDPKLYDPKLHPKRFAHTIIGGQTQRVAALELEGEERVMANRLLVEGIFRDLVRRMGDRRLAQLYALIHEGRGNSALCLSGGGIRSATFSLGVLQGLARYNLLDEFDYLSTVSGGGYIGSWLTAWIHRHPRGLEGVLAGLRGDNPSTRIEPEPKPLRHLREFSNFLTPRIGLFSADAWSFIAIIVRNLLLNWLVLVPLMLAALLLPRLHLAASLTPAGAQAWWALPSLLVAGFLLGMWAVAYMRSHRPSDSDPHKDTKLLLSGKAQTRFLAFCLLPLVLSGVALTLYWAMLRNPSGAGQAERPMPTLLSFLLFAILMHYGGWAASRLLVWGEDVSALSRIKAIFLSKEVLLAPLTGGMGGLLLWVAATQIFPHPVARPLEASLMPELYACAGVPLFLSTFFLTVTFFTGITARNPAGQTRGHRRRVSTLARIQETLRSVVLKDEDREWLARLSAWVLIVMLAWGLLSSLVVFGPAIIAELPTTLAAAGGLSGLLAVFGGGSSSTSWDEKEAARQPSWKHFIASRSVILGALAFLLFLVLLLSFLTVVLTRSLVPLEAVQSLAPLPARLTEAAALPLFGGEFPNKGVMSLVRYTPFWFVGALFLAATAFGLSMSWLVNLNIFSLHASYRNRIIRAYLGASRPSGERRPNPFTGFDPEDNIPMHALRPGMFEERDFSVGGRDTMPAFINHLREAATNGASADEASKHLYGRLSQLTRNAIERSEGLGGPPPQTLRAELIEDLNSILQDEAAPLFTTPPFAGRIPPEGKAAAFRRALEESKRADYKIMLNRLALEEVYRDEIARSKYPPPPFRLLHIVNTALNLVGGDKLAWQQRRAESFTVSPLHCGSLFVGYRRSRDYGGPDGITLGTAAAISGAAANSNMGYFTQSPLVTFVLTIFNARLGWWLGNPGPAGDDTYFLYHPRLAVRPIIDEAFGMTDDKNPYVLLSDGGHFENLGLYEMVVRRCRHIVVVDGSADPEGDFSDLGNAVRKVRIDFGISIDFGNPFPIYSRASFTSERPSTFAYCALGTINYADVDGARAPAGSLVYIKPSFYMLEPRDIYNYAKGSETFPHESTADQWFDEPQFESYRKLGSYAIDQIFSALSPEVIWALRDGRPDARATKLKLEDFRKQVEHYLRNLRSSAAEGSGNGHPTAAPAELQR